MCINIQNQAESGTAAVGRKACIAAIGRYLLLKATFTAVLVFSNMDVSNMHPPPSDFLNAKLVVIKSYDGG